MNKLDIFGTDTNTIVDGINKITEDINKIRNSFLKKDCEKFLRNCNIEQFKYNDEKEFWDILCREFQDRNIAVLRNIYNTMIENNHFNAAYLILAAMRLDIRSDLTYSDSIIFDDMLMNLEIYPLTELLKYQGFSWEILNEIHIVENLIKLKTLTESLGRIDMIIFNNIKTIELSEDELILYTKAEKLVNLELLRNIKNKKLYLENLNVLFADKNLELVEKFYNMPTNALFCTLFYKTIGIQIDKIYLEKSEYFSFEFWNKVVGLPKNGFVANVDKLSREAIIALIKFNAFLYCEDIQYLNPDFGWLELKSLDVCYSCRISSDTEFTDYTELMYLNYKDKVYSIFKGTVPYMVNTLLKAMRSYNSNAINILKTNVSNGTSVDYITAEGPNYAAISYPFTVLKLEELLQNLPVDEFSKIWVVLNKFGEKIKCHDLFIDYAIFISASLKLNTNEFIKLAANEPALMVSTILTSLVSCNNGALDFKPVLNKVEKYKDFFIMLSKYIKFQYNLSAAIIIRIISILRLIPDDLSVFDRNCSNVFYIKTKGTFQFDTLDFIGDNSSDYKLYEKNFVKKCKSITSHKIHLDKIDNKIIIEVK